MNGASSGEGLIEAVRDASVTRTAVREAGQTVRYEEVENDPGVSDKRLLLVETEFSGVLKQDRRSGNTLHEKLREAWDCPQLLQTMNAKPRRSTKPHISALGHITLDLLKQTLRVSDVSSGFGNRFLWFCVRRSKRLSRGGDMPPGTLEPLAQLLGDRVALARAVGAVGVSEDAWRAWDAVYDALSAGRPGLGGQMLSRSEAHARRLAMIYALLDGQAEVGLPHMLAALALISYCERSVRYMFGGVGDPLADDLLQLLLTSPAGLTRTELNDHFGGHQPAERIVAALSLLQQQSLARVETTPTAGRPVERWFAVIG
jgi:hypothetical protein